MDDLIDDALVAILKRLPLSERIRLEAVCRRWYVLMPYSDVGTFCLSDVPWTDRHVQELRYEVNQLTYSQPVMRPRWFCHYMHTLLRRVGPFLLKFSLNPRGLEYRPLVTAELVALLPSMAPAITELTMANCLMELETLDGLTELSRLEYLNLAGIVCLKSDRSGVVEEMALRERFNHVVTSLPSLHTLNLSNCPFVPSLRNDSLRKLQLQANAVNSQDLAVICSNCTQLQSLGLSQCRNLTEFGSILNLLHLRSIWLNSCRFKNEDLANLCRERRDLVSLRLDDCSLLTDFKPLKNLQSLETLWVGPSQQFGDASLARIARHGSLVNFMASCCPLTDQGLIYLANRCRNLREVSVSVTGVGDAGVITLLKNCSELSVLNVQYTAVTNEVLKSVATSGVSLSRLYVQSCRDIDEQGFVYLYESRRSLFDQCPSLEIQTGGERGNGVSSWIIARLATVAIHVIVQRPLLALPALPD